ncbi:MAG: 30S ribosomal protein S2 [Cryomorphaceae bacterium]|nr:30S ribosomal protein S2 [Cryomorphaceae bacterium]
MSKLSFKELLDAGVHFGHLKRKWNPAMAPYIFEEKKGIHIIDLNKTIVHLDQANAAMKQIAKSGKKILFVATKKQAKDIVAERIKNVNMPFVTERWSGGMLTNFQTTRKSIRKMTSIDKMKSDGTWDTLNKREKLFKTRQREKLEKTFGSISDMTRQPAAIFIVDILKEHIALAEARRLNIPTFALVDTNSNPKLVDFPIPANDDASKSITIIIDEICKSIQEGLEERKFLKDNPEAAKQEAKAPTENAEAEEVNEVKVEEKETVEPAAAEKTAKDEAPAKDEVKAEKAPAKKPASAKKAASAKKEPKAEKATAKKATSTKKEEKSEKAPAKKAAAKKPAAKKASAAKAEKEDK